MRSDLAQRKSKKQSQRTGAPPRLYTTRKPKASGRHRRKAYHHPHFSRPHTARSSYKEQTTAHLDTLEKRPAPSVFGPPSQATPASWVLHMARHMGPRRRVKKNNRGRHMPRCNALVHARVSGEMLVSRAPPRKERNFLAGRRLWRDVLRGRNGQLRGALGKKLGAESALASWPVGRSGPGEPAGRAATFRGPGVALAGGALLQDARSVLGPSRRASHFLPFLPWRALHHQRQKHGMDH